MEGTSPAPKKRSLFSQAARRKQTQAIDDDLIFNRAKELEAERLAEEERRRQKRIAKLEKKRSSASEERKEDTETPPKRRKLSREATDGNGSESESAAEETEQPTGTRKDSAVASPSTRSKNRPSYSKTPEAQGSPSNTLSGRYSKSLRNTNASPSQEKKYISITDSDSDDSRVIPVWKQGNKPISIDDEDDDDVEITFVSGNAAPEPDEEEEEEEFPELIMKARERERLRLEQAANATNSFSEKNHSQDDYDAFAEEQPVNLDFSVEILITSRIEGSIPLKVKRKLSQPLREARFAWCDRQSSSQFSGEELKNTIFLTWKNKRLFDYTTCVSLGLKLNDLGQEGKVHLEAWTKEDFEAAQKEEEAARRRDELGESESEEEVVEEEVVKYKLVMTAKDMEPVRLVVKNETPFSKLIAAFIHQRQIPEDKEVTLWLDGDMLEPDDTVADAELEDMDNIEVHVK